MVLEDFLQLWSCWASVKDQWDSQALPSPVNQESHSHLCKWTWIWYTYIHHKLMKSLRFLSRRMPSTFFSLAEKKKKPFQYKHPCEDPQRRHHASAQIKQAPTYLFPLIERDFSEHRVLSWKASGLVLGIESRWQPRVMLSAVDSEGVQALITTHKLCLGIQLPLLPTQTSTVPGKF